MTTTGNQPEFTVEPREGYLYLRLRPGFEMTPDSMGRMWRLLSESCRQHGVRHVLAEGEDVRRRLSQVDSFDHASLAASLMPGLTVACAFKGFVPDRQTEFFQVAAMNRGVRTEFFQELNDALRWLSPGR